MPMGLNGPPHHRNGERRKISYLQPNATGGKRARGEQEDRSLQATRKIVRRLVPPSIDTSYSASVCKCGNAERCRRWIGLPRSGMHPLSDRVAQLLGEHLDFCPQAGTRVHLRPLIYQQVGRTQYLVHNLTEGKECANASRCSFRDRRNLGQARTRVSSLPLGLKREVCSLRAPSASPARTDGPS
jgi:hypothetical protein